MDGGAFQNLCDAYLSYKGYKNAYSLGMYTGTDKTAKGNPDTYFLTAENKYVFVMYYLDAAERLGHLPMFMLALTAGLRQGELIALKWNDLNVKNRTLTISEQRSVERRELIEYGSETRTITLTSEVIDLLIMEHTKHPKSPLMFMHPATQRPYSPQMVRRMHNEIIKEAGLDHIRFTDLRHTCAVLSLRNGVETKELTRMLGHYRPSITRQNYEPYLLSTAKKDENMPKEATQSELQQAANVLDNLLKF